MNKNGNSPTVFIIDLTIIYVWFLAVFVHYCDWTPISFKAAVLMAFVAFFWFLIAINSNVSQINNCINFSDTIISLGTAYSVLSAGTIWMSCLSFGMC